MMESNEFNTWFILALLVLCAGIAVFLNKYLSTTREEYMNRKKLNINYTKLLSEVSLRARWVLVGIALVVALNSFDKVLTVNIWPSVLTAHGVM